MLKSNTGFAAHLLFSGLATEIASRNVHKATIHLANISFTLLKIGFQEWLRYLS